MGAWTDAEKYSFLLQVLKQSDKGPNYAAINLPGRTTKAMQHQWTAVKKEMAALGEDGGFGAVADEGAEEGEATMKATPKKRAAPKVGGTPKKAKKTAAAAEENVIGEYEEAADE